MSTIELTDDYLLSATGRVRVISLTAHDAIFPSPSPRYAPLGPYLLVISFSSGTRAEVHAGGRVLHYPINYYRSRLRVVLICMLSINDLCPRNVS